MKQTNKRPQLTISLLASNRPGTIRRCLDSVVSLMKEIPSELILVDTSNNPEIHKILLEYTDQVYEFKWCNDFAKARNVGLKKAKGEWFMFLDDDEWLVDVEEIVRFFRSGEYKKYACVDHRIRNFMDTNFERYSECWVTRLYKIEPDSAFRSKVHEYYAPIRGAKKRVYSLSYHSGYAYASEEQQREHFKRNTSLLYEMIEEEPKNFRWKMQLIQEYVSMEECEDLEQFCIKTLEELDKKELECSSAEKCCIYAGYVYALGKQDKNKEAIALIQKILKDSNCIDVLNWQLQYRLQENYFHLEDWDEATKYGQIFLGYAAEEEKRKEVIIYQNRILLLGEAFDEARIVKAQAMLIVCDLKKGRTQLLHDWYDKLQWKQTRYMIANKVIQHLVDAMGTLEYDSIYERVVGDAYQNPGLRPYMSLAAERWHDKDKEIYKKILRIFATADVDDGYIKRAKILTANWDSKVRLEEELLAYFKNNQNALRACKIVDEISQSHNIDIYQYWKSVDPSCWKKSVRNFFAKADNDDVEKTTQQVKRVMGEKDWRRLFYEMSLTRYRMYESSDIETIQVYVDASYRFYEPYYRAEEEIEGADYEELICRKEKAREALLMEDEDTYESLENKFYQYMVNVLEYYLTIYKDSAFCGEMEMLPPEACAAVWLNNFFGREETDWEGRICALRESGKACISIGEKIKRFAILVGERKCAYEESRVKSATIELQRMTNVMKDKIRQLISQGMKQEALAIIQQVRAISPEDQELALLEEEIK